MIDRPGTTSGREVPLHDHPPSGDGTPAGGSHSKDHPAEPAPALEQWVNEGGSLRPLPRRAVPSMASPRSGKAPGDTVVGCRARAAADLAMAATMDTLNGRRRFEHSAATWNARAGFLQRLADSSDSRRTAAMAVATARVPKPPRQAPDREEAEHVWL